MKTKFSKLIYFGIFAAISLPIFQNCSRGLFTVFDGQSTFSSLGLPGPGSSKLRRLSNIEYKNSLSDAITLQFSRQGSDSQASVIMQSSSIRGKLSILPQDTVSKRLGTDQLADALSKARFSAYVEIANGVADSISKDQAVLKAFVGNCVTSASDLSNATCVNSFITDFGTIVFRKPPIADEVNDLKKNATTWREIIGRILVHPRFVSHLEREGTLLNKESGLYQLTSFELEARLCSVFWKSIPDLQGLQVAASGDLMVPEKLRTEIKRILSSPKAKDNMWNFYQQWLGANRLPTSIDLNDPVNVFVKGSLPIGFGGILTGALQDAKDFLNYITWTSRGKLEDVFRSPLIFTTDAAIAAVYGVTPRADSTQPPITDLSGHYKGILTRVLITGQKPSVYGEANHILRGVLIATNLLGIQLGNPASFGEQNQAAGQVPAGASTRAEVTIKTSASNCISCHGTINPSGFALAHYDTFGRYLEVEKRVSGVDSPAGTVAQVNATNTIDSSTSLQINGKAYAISGAEGLVDALFQSEVIFGAFSKYYFRYAFGRNEDSQNDQSLLDSLSGSLKTGSVADALENMAMNPNFSRVRFTQ